MLGPKDSVEDRDDGKSDQEFKENADEKDTEEDSHQKTFHAAKKYLRHTNHSLGVFSEKGMPHEPGPIWAADVGRGL
jgi:hypothetical protein